MNDPDDFTRLNMHGVFAQITSAKRGVDQVFRYDIFKKFVSLVSKEKTNIQVLVLQTCRNCIKSADTKILPIAATDCQGLKIFTEIALSSLVTDVKVVALECIMMLCFYPEFKLMAVDSETISIVTKLTTHRKAACRAAAAGALMSITINCDAKKWIVREVGLLDRLVGLLKDKDELVVLNSIKVN